jgi:homoserine kinase type II
LNAITLLSQHVVEEALAHFNIGRLLRYWPASSGVENSNYFLQTTAGEYVLTLLERAPYSGDEYFNLLFTLDAAGLPVPAPLPDRGGRLDLTLQGKNALLQRKLPGSHTTLPTEAQLASLGRLVARLHLAAAPLESRIPEHPRNQAWLQQRAATCYGRIGFSAAASIESALATIQSVLSRADVAALPRGVIHGDIFRDNVLFDDNTLTGIIDFHHAALGPLIIDLGVIANDWCCDTTGQLNTEKLVALMKGYHSVRPLSRQELWFFSSFRLYAATSFWLSRLNTAIEASRDLAARTRNPREMERIVQNLLRGFEYIDERILDPNT